MSNKPNIILEVTLGDKQYTLPIPHILPLGAALRVNYRGEDILLGTVSYVSYYLERKQTVCFIELVKRGPSEEVIKAHLSWLGFSPYEQTPTNPSQLAREIYLSFMETEGGIDGPLQNAWDKCEEVFGPIDCGTPIDILFQEAIKYTIQLID